MSMARIVIACIRGGDPRGPPSAGRHSSRERAVGAARGDSGSKRGRIDAARRGSSSLGGGIGPSGRLRASTGRIAYLLESASGSDGGTAFLLRVDRRAQQGRHVPQHFSERRSAGVFRGTTSSIF
jgi:hypothetical protein